MANIPGINLLNLAMSVISKQTVNYYQYDGRSINSIGQDVAAYLDPIVMQGSWQPVPRSIYRNNGLDFQKDYFTFYTSNNILDIKRDVSGDQISINNKRYQCLSNNDWFTVDGWLGVLCVYIGDDNG